MNFPRLRCALLLVAIAAVSCSGPGGNETACHKSGSAQDAAATNDLDFSGLPASAAAPNLILFLVDDLGWQDLSVPLGEQLTGFNQRYRTPNIQRLASQGVKFTQAYAASPVCTPTRTSILRGQHPAVTRITDWTLYVDRDFSRGMKTLSDPDWNRNGLAPDPMLLTNLLAQQGYRTIHIGKAHFGAIGTPGSDPLQLGFERNVAGHAAGGPGSYFGEQDYGNQKKGPWGIPGLEAYHGSETFLTEALTLEAEKELEAAAADGRPFFLNMAHYAVHAPIQKDPRYYQSYRDAGLDDAEARYAGLISGVDDSLGRIWRKLEELEIADNTLILFFSDNGGLSAHGRGTTPNGTGKDTHNAPLRSGKGSGYEGGTRVPMIVAWAGKNPGWLNIEANSVNHSPVLSTDLYVSLLQLAGASNESIAATDADGQSFLPLLRGAKRQSQRRALAWHYPHKWGPSGDRYEPFTAFRRENWKIIYWYETAQWELFNLGEDVGETKNLIEEQSEVAAHMKAGLRAWMRKVDAQRPILKESGLMLEMP
jgi:arylsulfatase A-like enzyme